LYYFSLINSAILKKIGILSDTHGWIDDRIVHHLKSCDEIWHAGDIGTADVTDALSKVALLRAVYGNIDGADIRVQFPQHQHFECEGLRVFITHIGGYPGRYSSEAMIQINRYQPGLFICGHSHILKVMPDNLRNLLHINPGAAGVSGFHHIRTLVRCDIAEGKVKNLEVVELGTRGSAQSVGTFDE
jgi:putative phosphoesterase